jgi:hypothetical protein
MSSRDRATSSLATCAALGGAAEHAAVEASADRRLTVSRDDSTVFEDVGHLPVIDAPDVPPAGAHPMADAAGGRSPLTEAPASSGPLVWR